MKILIVVEQDQVIFHSSLGNETVIGRTDGYPAAAAVEVDAGRGDRGQNRILGQVDWLCLEITSVLGKLPIVRSSLKNFLQNGRGYTDFCACG